MKTKYWRLKHAQERQTWPNANQHQLERWYLLRRELHTQETVLE